MSAGMATNGLRLEQAPPLSIPVSFFLVAPAALSVAGAVLVWSGAPLLATRFAGATAALVHLGTLGVLAAVMLGALYQMIPVVAGAPVPAVRMAHAVHAALVAGGGSLVFGLFVGSRPALLAGAGLLTAAFVGFLLPISIALVRAPTRSTTVSGMRLAVASLYVLLTLGVLMALSRGSGAAAPRYSGWMAAHIGVGFCVWIGGLIAAVSFQVVPMFYLTASLSRWLQRTLVGLVAATLGLVLVLAVLGSDPSSVALAAAPAAASVWVVHPLATLVLIRRRRRRRSDPSLWFWNTGLGAALACLPLGLAAAYGEDFRWPVLFGWVVLFGWAIMIVHGMLTRIVPFLVWFHRFSHRVGKEPVPSMRQLLPEAHAKLGFGLHAGTLLFGVLAITTGVDLLARATGAGLVLTAAALFASVLRVLRHGRSPS